MITTYHNINSMTTEQKIGALVKGRTAIVFIEFQEEWLGSEGILFDLLIRDKEEFLIAKENAARVLEAARKNGWMIAHAGLDLRKDPEYLVFGESAMGMNGAIPRAGTWTGDGAKFIEPFIPAKGEFVVQGRSGASVLKNSNLDAFLRNNRIDTIVLLGFATHVCVESTMREAHDMGIKAWVVTDGAAAFTKAQHEYFLGNILHHFGGGIDSMGLIDIMSK